MLVSVGAADGGDAADVGVGLAGGAAGAGTACCLGADSNILLTAALYSASSLSIFTQHAPNPLCSRYLPFLC